jgi:hypothetical protein
MTGTNAEYNPFSGAVGPALTDPLASVPAATWGGLGPAQPDDMINMGSPYQNPDRVPVQSLSDGLLAPKISDRVPPTEGFVNASARRAPTGTEDDFLNEIVPGFGGPPVASNIPGAPEYDPLQDMQPSDVDQSIVAQNDLGNFNQTQVAKNGPTPAGWDTMTAAQAYDPLDEIKQALGIGAAPPDSFAEIPRPQDPLQAIKTALDIPGANVNLPGGNSRFQGKEWRPLTGSLSVPVPQQDLPVDPRVGLPNTGLPAQQAIAQPASAPPSGKDPERLVSIPQQDGTTITAPVSKDLLSQLPDDLAATLGKFLGGYANDETYQEGEQSAGNYSQYDTPAGNTAAYPSQGTVDPNSTEYVSAPETVPPQGEVQTADINQPMPEGDYPPNIDQSPTQGKAGNVAFSQKPKAPSTTTGNILETIVDLITRGTKGEDAKNDYNDYASMTPEEKQAWADRRAAEQQMADRQDGGNARNDAQQVENPDKAKIDELEAEIAALNAIIQARKAAKRSGKQRDLIMRNYS